MQRQILSEAFHALEVVSDPGTVILSKQQWPGSVDEAIQLWQPKDPSPIINELTPKFREILRQRRKSQEM